MTNVREDTIKKFLSLPATGLLGTGKIKVRVAVDMEGKLHSQQQNFFFDRCSATMRRHKNRTVFIKSVPMREALRNMHEDCTEDLVFQVGKPGCTITASVRMLMAFRAAASNRLNSSPTSLKDAILDLDWDYALNGKLVSLTQVGEVEKNHTIFSALGWERSYLTALRKRETSVVQFIHSFDKQEVANQLLQNTTELTQDSFRRLIQEERVRLDEEFLVHVPNYASRSVKPSLKKLYGIKGTDLAVMPSAAAHAVKAYGLATTALTSGKAPEVLEAVAALYAPNSDGVFKDLKTAYEAALRI